MSKNDDTTIKNGQGSKTKAIVKKNVLAGMNISKLSNMRIIQKHLVYVIGLSSGIASKESLGKYEYFGQYGTISKIVVNKAKAYNPNGPNGPSFSAYISYSSAQEASIAILAIDNIEIDDHILRASYGTTKYCTFFLKNCDCPNKDCLYLHSLADENDILNKDDMNSNTSIFYDQQLLAIKLADIYNTEVKKKLKTPNKKKTVFPNPDSIYSREIVMDLNPIKEERVVKGSGQKGKKKYNDEYCDGYFDSEYRNSINLKKSVSSKNKFIELEKNENENDNHSDNNFTLIREKSERIGSTNIINTKNKKIDLNNSNFTNQSFSNSSQINNTSLNCSKFISKSKSPITSKAKIMNLNEEGKKDLKTNNNSKINFEPNPGVDQNKTSPHSSLKLIQLENEITDNKNHKAIKQNEIKNDTNYSSWLFHLKSRMSFNEKLNDISLDDSDNNKNSAGEEDVNKFIKSIILNEANIDIIDHTTYFENNNDNCRNSLAEENKLPVKSVKKLYRKWDKSRFSFVNKNKINYNTIEQRNSNKGLAACKNLNIDKEEKNHASDMTFNDGNRNLTLTNILNGSNNKNFKLTINNGNNTISENKINSSSEGEPKYLCKNSIAANEIKNKNINSNENNSNTNALDVNMTINDTYNSKNVEELKNKEDEEDKYDIVPDYVYDVIRKKISRYTFFKKFEKDFKSDYDDYFYFEKDLNHNDSWSQFIMNNLEKPKIK